MTDDFREGLISAFDQMLKIIEIQRSNPSGTDDGRKELATLESTIRIELEELER